MQQDRRNEKQLEQMLKHLPYQCSLCGAEVQCLVAGKHPSSQRRLPHKPCCRSKLAQSDKMHRFKGGLSKQHDIIFKVTDLTLASQHRCLDAE